MRALVFVGYFTLTLAVLITGSLALWLTEPFRTKNKRARLSRRSAEVIDFRRYLRYKSAGQSR